MCDEYWSNIDIKMDDAQLYEVALMEGQAHRAALSLKKKLCEHKLNLVTCESVTSGLIASTMSGVGVGGPYLYGGFVVYDTDAKRRWCNVTTPNLYHSGTALEMAKGALLNSGAMVSLAITGNALPYSDSLMCTGIADVAVCIRGHMSTQDACFSRRINVCQSNKVCGTWISKYVRDSDGNVIGYPSPDLNYYINKIIRAAMVKESLEFCYETIEKAFRSGIVLEKIPIEPWMKDYGGCGEPGDIIMRHLADAEQVPKRSYPKYSDGKLLCHETNSVASCPKYKKT